MSALKLHQSKDWGMREAEADVVTLSLTSLSKTTVTKVFYQGSDTIILQLLYFKLTRAVKLKAQQQTFFNVCLCIYSRECCNK